MSSCLVLRRHLSLLLSTVLEKRVSTTEGGCWCRRQSTVHSQCCSSNEGKRSPGCESSWCSSTQKPCCLCYLGWWLCCTTSLPGGGPCPVPECQWGPCGGVEALSRVPGAAGPAASPLPSRAGPVCVSTSSPRLQSLSSGEQQRGGNNPGVLKCCWDLRAGFLSLFGGMQEEGEHLLEPCRSSSSFTWMCAGGSGVQLGAPRSRQCRRAVQPPSQHGHRSAPGARRPSPWHLHHPTWCQECSWWGWRCWLLLAPAWGRAATTAQPRGVSWRGCVAASRQRCRPWSAAARLRSDLSWEEVCLGGAGGALPAVPRAGGAGLPGEGLG